ncbi:DUF7472 family protein [Halorhabdus amylolytica]|uniref:DUF7472 family protein n=1 Tax=Halorhabdus amylolytica TaxID=2559573 RepID=UPI0010AABEA8|nr:hypothetical protein [Halorhabdus amylolytica]
MDRETLLQVAVSTVVVLLFIGVLAVLSSSFTTDDTLTRTGGYALVGALFGFVVVISAAGLLVTRYGGNEDENDSDDENGDDDS